MKPDVDVCALLRHDFHSFVHMAFRTVFPGTPYCDNWHIEAIAFELMRVHSGENRRLLINQPPRSLKSLTISVAYVAWVLGQDPSRRFIVASYSSDFAAELHRLFRALIDAPWYRKAFPEMVPVKDTGSELVTSAGGGRYATSVGGTLTGRGADAIIVDDPLKAEEAQSELSRKRAIDWYGGTLVTRLNDKGTGAIIVVMQRLHEDDLSGHLLSQGGWRHLNLPAIALEDQRIQVGPAAWVSRRRGDVLHPAREPLVALQLVKREIGGLMFSAQYQQAPVPLEGNLIRRAWFRSYDRLPPTDDGAITAQSWDVAMMTGSGNDFSVCATWMIIGADYYLLDVFRGRLEYPDLRRKVLQLANVHQAGAILIEEAGPGLTMLQELHSNLPAGVVRPIGVVPKGSKADRMAAQSAAIEAGHVYLPSEAPWLAEFLNELLGFPNGRHDDQVDSVSQFLIWAAQRYVPDDRVPAPRSVGGGPREDFSYY